MVFTFCWSAGLDLQMHLGRLRDVPLWHRRSLSTLHSWSIIIIAPFTSFKFAGSSIAQYVFVLSHATSFELTYGSIYYDPVQVIRHVVHFFVQAHDTPSKRSKLSRVSVIPRIKRMNWPTYRIGGVRQLLIWYIVQDETVLPGYLSLQECHQTLSMIYITSGTLRS